MITTLLFDLDDTLLNYELGAFVPAYIQALASNCPPLVHPQLAPALWAGMQAITTHNDPQRPLYGVFSEAFSTQVGQPPEAWEPWFEQFYAGNYRNLQQISQAQAAARPLLEWALAAGYEVVLATAPFYPLQAVQQRLAWAGLADIPFALITNLEAQHFSKPRPEYYAEVLALLGRRPDEAVMVGNDWENDMAPAAVLGMPHFWINDRGLAAGPSPAVPLGTGTLTDFHRWAQANLPELHPPPAAPEQALPAQLAGNLAALIAVLAQTSAPHWTFQPQPQAWSVTEIVCHLRDVENEVHGERIQLVVSQENPFISGADTDPWAVERNYRAQSGPAALAAFVQARLNTLAFLRGLPTAAWQRPARHAIFGPTHLAEIVDWALEHDRLHLRQIRENLKGQP